MSKVPGSRSSPGIVGKLGISLFFAAFLAMGLFFLVLLCGEVGKILGTYTWKETAATILGSSVGEKKGASDPFFAEVSFRYQWEGRSYISDKYHSSPKGFDEYDTVQAQISGIPKGAATVCYVNPKNPAEAILRREGLGIAFFLLLPLVFIAVGGGGIYGTWAARSARQKALSSPGGSGLGRGGTLLFGGVFAAVGGGVLVFWFLPALAKSVASTRWTETPCTVISSRVKEHSDSDGATYSVDIFYRYTVDGREYKSNRYGSLGGSSSGYRGKAAVVAKYPAGSQRVCYVNPKNPNEVLLKRGVGWELLFGLIPVVFLGAGVLLMASSRKKSGRLSPDRTALPAQALEATPSSEPRDLKVRTSPLGRLIGVVVFALIWNGVVAVFLWNVIGDARRGSPDYFLMVFLTPFVLIGLGTLAAVGYCAMALMNPRCRLRVTPAVLHPGETLEVAWSFSGSVQRLQRLRIVLEGREEATYRRGTSNYTDRHAFARLAVTEVTQGLEMAQGEARCRLPEGVPPGFHAPNNKIVWTLKIHGEIPHWPDVNEEYEITVVTGGGK